MIILYGGVKQDACADIGKGKSGAVVVYVLQHLKAYGIFG
jgi:hypothetical protein